MKVQDLDIQVAPFIARLEAGQGDDGRAWWSPPPERPSAWTAGPTSARRTFQATGKGVLELRALSALLEEASLTGLADVDVVAGGSFRDPHAQGTVRVRDATLRARDIRQPLTAINVLVTVEERTIRLTDGTRELRRRPGDHGGHGAPGRPLRGRRQRRGQGDRASGCATRSAGAAAPCARSSATSRRASNADLTLTGKPGDFLLAGSVAVERSLYDTDIFLEEALLAPTVPPRASPSPRACCSRSA